MYLRTSFSSHPLPSIRTETCHLSDTSIPRCQQWCILTCHHTNTLYTPFGNKQASVMWDGEEETYIETDKWNNIKVNYFTITGIQVFEVKPFAHTVETTMSVVTFPISCTVVRLSFALVNIWSECMIYRINKSGPCCITYSWSSLTGSFIRQYSFKTNSMYMYKTAKSLLYLLTISYCTFTVPSSTSL